MKKFNQMTEIQMGKVNGGVIGALIFGVTSFIAAGTGLAFAGGSK